MNTKNMITDKDILNEMEENLKEFEMIELKGGQAVLFSSNNINCTNKNCPDNKCYTSAKGSYKNSDF